MKRSLALLALILGTQSAFAKITKITYPEGLRKKMREVAKDGTFGHGPVEPFTKTFRFKMTKFNRVELDDMQLICDGFKFNMKAGSGKDLAVYFEIPEGNVIPLWGIDSHNESVGLSYWAHYASPETEESEAFTAFVQGFRGVEVTKDQEFLFWMCVKPLAIQVGEVIVDNLHFKAGTYSKFENNGAIIQSLVEKAFADKFKSP
jgi:hypothetical protein